MAPFRSWEEGNLKIRMTKKRIMTLSIIIITFLLIYQSCEVIPIEEMEKGFDPQRHARKLWLELQGMMENLGVGAGDVLNALDENPENAHQKYAQIVGVSNYRYYIIRGVGEIVEIKSDGIIVKVRPESETPELFFSKYIFGNAIVNATGITKMEDYDRIVDFNLVSTQLNNIVREEVVEAFLDQLSKGAGREGSLVKFIGVFTLLRDETVKYPLKVAALHLEITHGGF